MSAVAQLHLHQEACSRRPSPRAIRRASRTMYLAAAANHAELERHMRERERAAVTFEVSFSH